ncbi:hypothetical protein NDU88_005069 [Pleurodeles waltl]|uniref:Uncharacterized protein n=1 Tax=Pleurodeles waltl TaxID=8319 RepID=A0AAV7V4S6_PLEWA|nr:hypothetical protein NDU88_005069 [Pleurodeles waltl]
MVIRTGRTGHCGTPLICARVGSNNDRQAEGIALQGAHIGLPAVQQGGIQRRERYTTRHGSVQARARVGPQYTLAC